MTGQYRNRFKPCPWYYLVFSGGHKQALPFVISRYEGPVSWKEFYTKMLMAGEVESIEVVSLNEGNSVARVYLYPDAVYNGVRFRRSYFSLDMGR